MKEDCRRDKDYAELLEGAVVRSIEFWTKFSSPGYCMFATYPFLDKGGLRRSICLSVEKPQTNAIVKFNLRSGTREWSCYIRTPRICCSCRMAALDVVAREKLWLMTEEDIWDRLFGGPGYPRPSLDFDWPEPRQNAWVLRRIALGLILRRHTAEFERKDIGILRSTRLIGNPDPIFKVDKQYHGRYTESFENAVKMIES